jgi:hypothetical protein
MKFGTKDIIAFRVNDIFMKEGVIVGSITQGNKTEYRILHNNEFFDVKEEDVVPLDEWATIYD